MRYLIFIFSALIPSQIVFNQTVDTLFLDTNKFEVTKEECGYYRILTHDSNDLYICKDFTLAGIIEMTGNFRSLDPEIREGEFRWYHENGSLKQITNYSNNNVVGMIQMFDNEGNLDIQYITKIDSLDNSTQFKDKINDFRIHVAQNLQYPIRSAENGIDGKVVVRFFINDKGKAERLFVTESVADDLDKEAKRVIKNFNKWPIPLYKGESTYIDFNFPVIFVLQ